MFQVGAMYTRRQINQAVGGSLISYLPTVMGQVVAPCLRLDTNPDAPEVILPGAGAGIESAARSLVAQRSAVPTFLRRGPNRWEFVGNYAAVRSSRDPADLAFQQTRWRLNADPQFWNTLRGSDLISFSQGREMSLGASSCPDRA